MEHMRQVAMLALREVFRPEFINRLDEIVVYRQLEREQIRRIVDIQLGRLQSRLRRRQLSLEISDAAKDYLAHTGYDPQFGARPLKRAIQRHLEDVLARRVLQGDFPAESTIRVDYDGSELVVLVEQPAAVAPVNGQRAVEA
jgi:ATP-dependent Clp protease ATP-binding subunit ClpB